MLTSTTSAFTATIIPIVSTLTVVIKTIIFVIVVETTAAVVTFSRALALLSALVTVAVKASAIRSRARPIIREVTVLR
ncbi:hypothetical protein D3C76_1689950 [compost metagenome]